jgi:hypothetical protein
LTGARVHFRWNVARLCGGLSVSSGSCLELARIISPHEYWYRSAGRPALTLVGITGDDFCNEDLSLVVIAEQGAMPAEDFTLDAIQRVGAVA